MNKIQDIMYGKIILSRYHQKKDELRPLPYSFFPLGSVSIESE